MKNQASDKSILPLLYHTHHSLEAGDLPFWLDWAHRQAGPILELGCGTGRVLLPLAEARHTIYGLDHDPDMLEFLRVSVPDSIKNRVILIRGDLRNYCLSIRFPFILMPCNTYSTLSLEDRRTVLARARLHIAERGVFIFSMPNPVLLEELSPEGESENETSFSHPITANPVQVSSQWKRVILGVQFYWHYDHLLPDGRVERYTFSSTHHFQDVDQILLDIEGAGLDIVQTCGDFDGSPFDLDSPHMIIVSQS